MIWLQRAVNWEVGQKVLIVTSIYKDELNNQNEVRTITAIKGEYAHHPHFLYLSVAVLRVRQRHSAGLAARLPSLCRQRVPDGSGPPLTLHCLQW